MLSSVGEARLRADGKMFWRGGGRFRFRGVSYGTFGPRDGDGARYPDRERMKLDLEAMGQAGFTVVRTYTPAPDDLLELAVDSGLLVFPTAFFPDWRYLVGASRRQVAATTREARRTVRAEAKRLAGDDRVALLSLGNEIPADVIRWVGTRTIGQAIGALVEEAKQEDPDLLVTYASYPTTEYLPLPTLDVVTFNVFLEREADLRRYLTRLHHIAGERPLLLGEVGLDAGGAGGEERQAAALEWQLRTAVERGCAGTTVFSWTDEWHVGDAAVEGWSFGLTTADRRPRAALPVCERWNRVDVRDLDHPWPSTTVVICAYNAEATIDECLAHTCALEYPGLEVLVVDDGSTDRTAEIVRGHPRARLVQIPHAGLSVARNVGYAEAKGELVAYLDSDAYPTPEWPWFLALGLDGPTVGGVGGPNVPPVDDGWGAQQVARAPGGPVQVLLGDDRAEHIPGCNMAFWKPVLEEVGGCDPVYQSAGDDVDLCWKVLDRGWEIGFHPAALVWHHRRTGLRPYLRQQRGYGRAEALVEARHPDRFTLIGTARWHGRIYDSINPPGGRQRVYRGLYGTAAYQSVYRGGGHALDLAHQVGVPLAVAALPVAAAAAIVARPVAAAVAGTSAAALGTLVAIDVARIQPPRGLPTGHLRFRAGAAAMHLLQPLVRTWGRVRHQGPARRQLRCAASLAGPVTAVPGALLLPLDRPRADVVADVVALLRRDGWKALPASGWEDHDVRLVASALLHADLITSDQPAGCLQLRVDLRPRPGRAAAVAVAVAALAAISPSAATAAAGGAAVDLGRGWWRARRGVRKTIEAAT